MAAASESTRRRRPVSLTLSEELVASARRYSDNLSATVEALLSDYVRQQEHARRERLQQAQACANEWNRVHDALGSFADEHSTL
ncbi:MAG: type II toxin-antitoxin system CcdA family antitoxin [Burkholderiaceae bacterium]